MASPARYPPLIPNILETPTLNMLAGASGIGKTALLTGLLGEILAGRPVFDHAITPPPAIGYICADRPSEGALKWQRKVGIEHRVVMYDLIGDLNFDLAQLLPKHAGPPQLAYCIEQLRLPYGSLIIVDPIALFIGVLNDYRSVGIACARIQRWLMEHPYCVVGIAHVGKQKADPKERYLRPQDRILGSGAQLGYTGTQMALLSPEESGRKDGRYTFLWNPHDTYAQAFHLAKRPQDGTFDFASIMVDDGDVPEVLTPDLATLLALLPDPPKAIATAGLIQLCQDTARPTLFRRLQKLLRLGLVEQPKRGLWCKREPTPKPLL